LVRLQIDVNQLRRCILTCQLALVGNDSALQNILEKEFENSALLGELIARREFL
jgi:hypothetical protein